MISAQLRRTVRTLYAFTCGYCGVSENEVGAYLTIDHFIPQDAGGPDTVDNLVYACHACNLFKASSWDPSVNLVLHPLLSDMALHVRLLSDGLMEGLTAEGRQHIETLHLNRPPLVERRRVRRLIEAVLEREAQQLEREKIVDSETQAKKKEIRRKTKKRR